MSKILGLSFFYHDSAAALVIDGLPVAMAQEERFSRKKHDFDFPINAIKFVLEKGGTTATNLDWVVFYEKPFLKLTRVLKTYFATFPKTPLVFAGGLKNLFITKLWIRELIVKKIGVDPKKILFSEHHLSHAASAFFNSPYKKSAILTIDGVGEWTCTALGVGKGSKIELLKEIHFPHSLGLFYSAFTAFLGFEVNEGEYKVMGMAPYGRPRYIDKIKKLITAFEDGSYKLNLDYFSFHRSTSRTFSNKFVELFGKPRDPKSKFFTRNTGWPSYFGPQPNSKEYDDLAKEQEYYADVAASLQKVLEEVVVKLAQKVYSLTGLDKLCYAGGVALNCVANAEIFKNTPFKEIFIQPAAGDAGGALGAALAVEIMALGGERKFVQTNAYYGQEYAEKEIKSILEKNEVEYQYEPNENQLMDFVSDQLRNGKVIGWFNGRFEWGPRALGNRSILADPRRPEMKNIVNTKIKFREPYRPFAPSVLAEHAHEFFEIPSHFDKCSPFSFMLYVVPVKKEKQAIVPAITHVDGTARPQFVYKDTSPRYWELINCFYKKTGIPLILNTSFNLKGEPIVSSPEDALATFEKSGLDILVLENFIIQKSGYVNYEKN